VIFIIPRVREASPGSAAETVNGKVETIENNIRQLSLLFI
jgi:hypothetical protein